MQKNFWTDLYLKKKASNEPIIVLAPMADVTDYVFRNLIVEKSDWGHLDVLWTEFVSVNGLSNEKGGEVLIKNLRFNKQKERPIVAQIFGEDPENYTGVARLCAEMGFDGVDINMGCPDKNVLGQKAGSYLINTPDVARKIVENTKLGVSQYISEKNKNIAADAALRPQSAALHLVSVTENERIQSQIPVSVKTRIGYNEINWKAWLSEILQTKPAVITIHLRTRKEMSLVPAHWELSQEIVVWIRENFKTVENGGPIIILNGDVKDVPDAYKKWELSKCDGIMIGRGIFGNPWLFSKTIKKENLPIKIILKTLVEHAHLFEKELSFKSFAIMKKHFKAYVNGFDGAKDLRVRLMEATNAKEVEKVVNKFLFWDKLTKFFKIFRW